MIGRILLAIACLDATAAAQGTETRPKPDEYSATMKLGTVTIAAENWGHGISTKEGSLGLSDYVAIEVAVYTEGNKPITLSSGHFRLRVNEKKIEWLPQSPGMVVASVKYSDWEQRPELTGTAGNDNGQVILGRRAPTERFPGDPRAQQGRIPRAPDPDDQGRPKVVPLKPEDVLLRSVLPEGEVHPPVSGYIFFAYKGKLKAMKTVELIYDGPAGSTSVVLP